MVNLTQKTASLDIAGTKYDIVGIQKRVVYILLITFFVPIILVLGLLLLLRHK